MQHKTLLFLIACFFFLGEASHAQSAKINQKQIEEFKAMVTSSFKWDIEDLVIDTNAVLQYRVYIDSAHSTYRSWEFKINDLKTIQVVKDENDFMIKFDCDKADCIHAPAAATMQTNPPKNTLEITIKSKKQAESLVKKLNSFNSKE